MSIGDKVIIKIPTQTGGLISHAMKKYNHKIATITAVNGNNYKLNLDGGKYMWPPGVLGLIVRS